MTIQNSGFDIRNSDVAIKCEGLSKQYRIGERESYKVLRDVITHLLIDLPQRDAEVYVDGGIRRGVDVVIALALGARAVMVGRPVLWGLTVGGADGVAVVRMQAAVSTSRISW